MNWILLTVLLILFFLVYYYTVLVQRFLFFTSGFLPVRFIKINNQPYLERYYLCKVLGFTFYLHRFVSGDSERSVHNHPWKSGGSLVLCGSYVESRVVDICPWADETGCILKTHVVSVYNAVNGNVFHRIDTAMPNTWTLFFHSEKLTKKHWGWLSREYVGGELVTLFKTHPNVTPNNWWKKAPIGNLVPRCPRDIG